MRDAIVFDIDGTLWDASAASATGFDRALAALGLEARLTTDDVRGVTGRPFDECVRILTRGLEGDPEVFLREFERYERAAVRELGGALYDGVAEGIRELSGSFRLFLASNCSTWYLECFLDHSGLRDRFEAATCYGLSGKPKGETLRDLRDAYGLVSPAYVGDTAGDESASATAGMDFYYVSYGFGAPVGDPPRFGAFADLARHFAGSTDGAPRG